MRRNRKIIIKDDEYKMIDLCAGTGAFSYAFLKNNNVKVVYANDYDESSKKIYDENFNHKLVCKNICDLDITTIPDHDILTAGFPCQSFSIAGKQLGFQDPRANVFWKISKIIEHHKPKVVLLENVKNLLTHDNGKTFEIISETIKKLGYFMKYKVLNTSTITEIPQHRERIYIICFKNKNDCDKFDFEFEKKEKKHIQDILITNKVDDKYYYNKDTNIHKMIREGVVKKDTVYQYRRVYVRENKSNECPTLTANMGTGGHNVPIILDNYGVRKLTPQECFNFQGFPNDYKLCNISDSKLYKLAGNAVSVPVVMLISKKIMDIINY